MSAMIIITSICLISVILSYVAFKQGFTRNADDYFVAGSSLGYFVLIFSLLASFLSAFSMFGMASLGYRTGYGALYVLTVNLVPLGFLWYFMHKKTLILGRARRWMSMGAPFGERYGKSMRAIIPIVVLIASIPYLVAQIQGIGIMVETMTEGLIPYKVGLFFIPAFITVYLMMGGMKGSAWVNTVQGIFFTVMVFILFGAVMAKNGGFGPTMDLVYQKHPELFQLGWNNGKVWSYPMICRVDRFSLLVDGYDSHELEHETPCRTRLLRIDAESPFFRHCRRPLSEPCWRYLRTRLLICIFTEMRTSLP
ncbi:sodium:solute symporter family protein [Desulfatirhabdium butyrativorans]|uniref:sodium:solute symporter family protein n=1 Tax=Desulfatirhabdium butyrativorans TaxID=340467 RepID=UPI000407E9CB|nr:hypothetical protein [Desulfatirhabdium butyrativorans]